MNMLKPVLVSMLLIASSACAFAASEDDYKAAYAAAEAANKEAGSVAQPVDHDGGNAGSREEVGRSRRLRQGHRSGQGSRSVGKSFELPGHQREDPLERSGNTLARVRRNA